VADGQLDDVAHGLHFVRAERWPFRFQFRPKFVAPFENQTLGRYGFDDLAAVDGVGLTSQKYLPGTRLVRAFNTLNYKKFASEANRPTPKLAVPIAGDAAAALQPDVVVVGKLADASLFQRGAPGY
jgi:8-hydroxy-5-deazaflavin:NADPH oxidoreductase